MIVAERVRVGGRSARIQAAVHQAVKALSAELGRAALTIPIIAAHAGVTPSTIYRRWGDLPDLLADVAVERLRPIADPADCGSMKADLRSWAEQFMEEMSSDVGRAMLRDIYGSGQDGKSACQCCGYTEDHLRLISERAKARGEPSFDIDEVIDHLVAPIIYRILNGTKPLSLDYCRALVDRAMSADGSLDPASEVS
jgi:AcrR family transcriptional regulator